jgi:hypothetical protein
MNRDKLLDFNYEYKRIINFFKGGSLNRQERYILLFPIIFGLWIISIAKACPCPAKKNKQQCYRAELYGVQFNHIYLFIFLGYFFTNYFYTIQFFGIIWEVFEYWIDNNKWSWKHFGGCLDKKPKQNNWHSRLIVYSGKEKSYNPIDKIFGIKNSKVHGWHHSIAEIVANILGFIIGAILHFYNINILYLLMFVMIIIFLDI